MQSSSNQTSPGERLLRLPQIIGDRARGIEPRIPVGRSTWLAGVAAGRFPAPVRLAPRVVAWREADIDALIAAFRG